MENITFSQQLISCINGGGIILISAILIIAIIVFMRYAPKLIPGMIGVCLYLLVVFVGAEFTTMILTMIPGVNSLLINSSIGFCIIRGIIIALLMSVSAWLVVKLANRNCDVTVGTAMIGGLGIAIGDAILNGMDFLYLSAMATTVNNNSIEELVQGMTAEEADTLIASIKNVASTDGVVYIVKGLNCALSVVFIVALAIIAYALIKYSANKVYLLYATIADALLIATATYSSIDYTYYLIIFLIRLTITGLMVYAVIKLDQTVFGGEIASFDKLRTGKTMPKFNNLKNK